MTLNFLNWNCNGIYSKYEHLQLLLKKYNTSVILLRETNLPKNKKFFLKNYTTYRKEIEDMDRAHGGIVLSVKNDIIHYLIPLQTHLQALAASLQFKNKSITLCCIYLPPYTPFKKWILNKSSNNYPHLFSLQMI